jgi:hypothetical protein
VEEDDLYKPAIRALAVGPIVAGVLVFAACSGGDNTPKTPSPTATPESGLPLAVAKFRDSSYRADYRLTGAPGQQFGDGTLTWYKSGSDKLRFDLASMQDGQTVELVFVETPVANGFCFKNSGELGPVLGVAPDQGVCFNSDGQDSGVDELTNQLTNLQDAQGLQVLEESQRLIAGVVGDCFKTQNTEGATEDACISSDGVLLYMKDADGSTFEATSVAPTINDADFNLPYEVRQIPGVG